MPLDKPTDNVPMAGVFTFENHINVLNYVFNNGLKIQITKEGYFAKPDTYVVKKMQTAKDKKSLVLTKPRRTRTYFNMWQFLDGKYQILVM